MGRHAPCQDTTRRVSASRNRPRFSVWTLSEGHYPARVHVYGQYMGGGEWGGHPRSVGLSALWEGRRQRLRTVRDEDTGPTPPRSEFCERGGRRLDAMAVAQTSL